MFSIIFMDKQTRSRTYIVIIPEFTAITAFGLERSKAAAVLALT